MADLSDTSPMRFICVCVCVYACIRPRSWPHTLGARPHIARHMNERPTTKRSLV